MHVCTYVTRFYCFYVLIRIVTFHKKMSINGTKCNFSYNESNVGFVHYNQSEIQADRGAS